MFNKLKQSQSLVWTIAIFLLIVVGFLVFVYNKKPNTSSDNIPGISLEDSYFVQYFSNQELKTSADVLPPENIRTKLEDNLRVYSEEIKTQENQENGNPYSGYLGVANTYRQLGDFTKALDAYEILLDKYPNDFLAWHNLGVLYEDMNQYLEAAKAYKKSINSKPVESMAYMKLADLYVKFSNNPEMAQDVYEEGIANTNDDIQLLKFYAIYLEEVLKDNQKAISIWQKVLDKEPDNQDVKTRISDLEKNK